MRSRAPSPTLLLALLLVLLAGCAAAPSAGPGVPTTPQALDPVRVLQLNLCNSGMATSCFTGRAPEAGADAVRAEGPDLVTLNEVCDDDVATIARALAEVTPGGEVASAFRAARNGTTGEPYRCTDGREYGIGVVARGTPAGGSTSGVFPDQDPEDPEQRVWLCLDTVGGAPGVCTTHLAYTDAAVTEAQCRHLFGTVIPSRPTTVVGADLNIGPEIGCLPPGAPRVGDGGPQHIVGPVGSTFADTRLIDMQAATDHPGLLVDLTPGATMPG